MSDALDPTHSDSNREIPVNIDSLTKDALCVVLAAAARWSCTPMDAAARLLNELLKSSAVLPDLHAAASLN